MPIGIYKRTEEHKNKIRLAHIGKKHPHSEGTKKKIGDSNRGKIHSEETKKRLSISHMGNTTGFQKGHKGGGFTGKHHGVESKEKMSNSKICSIKTQRGDKCWNWKGGVTKDANYKKNYNKKYKVDNYKRILYINRQRRNRKISNGGSYTYQEWEKLLAQYNWTCPCCHKSEPEIKLTEDHIIPLSKGGSSNIENIQPLCRSCNCRKHTKVIKY